MSSTYQIFRDASNIVKKHWLQHGFIDGQGNQCLVQSVMTSAGRPDIQTLPPDFLELIDQRLMSYADYRVIRRTFGDAPLQYSIMSWNDVPWRRRGAVVKVLGSIADELAEMEIARLTTEILQLKEEVATLKDRVAQLEAENTSLWRRLTSYFDLEHDKAELNKLNDHLDQKWSEFQAIKV